MSQDWMGSQAHRRILIVEDSPTQARRLRHILEQEGYEVAAATNGRLALEMIADFNPALVISDVVMPEMDGYELSRRIKADPALRDTPVILVTTMSDPEDVIRGLACGADNFVLKPYSEQYLLDRAQHVLINRRMRQAEDAVMGVEIFFKGQRHFITAGRLQILNLLLSTYEAAIQRNRELTSSREALQAVNARLDIANKELESFSYSVSHDLRAPLRHIDGFVQLLTARVGDALDEQSRGYLETISASAGQMGQLIDDLLEFARMGRADLMQEPVPLTALAEEAIRGLGDLPNRTIRWNVGSLPTVQADLAMMRQVFANLLSNAVKYTRGRSVAEIAIDCSQSSRDIIVSVRDNGVGFDAKYADKLFGVFQRLHRADDFEGTGVGLANVRRIIARHGGSTWAEGAVGEGATFSFSLPIDRLGEA